MPKLSKSDKAAKVSQTEARRRKEVALARLRELELEQKRAKLLDAEAVQSFWANQCGGISRALQALPDRIAEQLAGKDAAAIRAALRAEIEGVLNNLAETITT